MRTPTKEQEDKINAHLMKSGMSSVCGDRELEHYEKMVADFLDGVRTGDIQKSLGDRVYMHIMQLGKFIYSIQHERRLRERVEKENEWLKERFQVERLENAALTKQFKDAFTDARVMELAIALHNEKIKEGHQPGQGDSE